MLIRQHRLIHQRLYRHTLEARCHIMALLRRDKRWELVRRKRGIFAHLGLHSAQHGRLEAREGEIVLTLHPRLGQSIVLRVALRSGSSNSRATRVGQANDFRYLVEGFAHSIILRLAKQGIIAMRPKQHQLTMPTRDDERQHREIRLRSRKCEGRLGFWPTVLHHEVGIDVRLHMMNRVERLLVHKCQRPRRQCPDQQ